MRGHVVLLPPAASATPKPAPTLAADQLRPDENRWDLCGAHLPGVLQRLHPERG